MGKTYSKKKFDSDRKKIRNPKSSLDKDFLNPSVRRRFKNND